MRFQTHNVHVTKCLPENLPFIYRVGGPYRESLCVRSVELLNFSFRFFPLHALNFEQNLVLSIVKFSLCVAFLKFTI